MQPYNLATHSLQSAYYFGGELKALDISPDDSFLLITQLLGGPAQGAIHKRDLLTGKSTNINFSRGDFEGGAWDVSIAANGRAFFTTTFHGSGTVPLREINLATNTVSARSDFPDQDIQQDSQIERSADRKRLFFLGSNNSGGPLYSYSATTNSFSPTIGHADTFLDGSRGAVNRNGTLLGLRPLSLNWMIGERASLLNPTNFGVIHHFPGLDSGIAFDATRDIFYGVNTATKQIIAYDSNTFAEMFRRNLGVNVERERGTLIASPDGRYLAFLTGTGARIITVASGAAIAIPAPTPADPNPIPPVRLANISTRMRTGTGDQVLIGGFIITGTVNKKVAVRAMGPSLSPYNIAGALKDPILELRDSHGTLVTSNDDWWESPKANEITAAQLAPENNFESVIIATLAPGAYTAIVRGYKDTTGVALVEAYDLDNNSSRLANISSRGKVSTGDEVLIGGFIMTGTGPNKIVVRAIGPSLAGMVPGFLSNPTLEIHNADGTLVLTNDDWQSNPTQAALIQQTGLAPTNPRESAFVGTLYPGPYTAIVRGANNTTGIGVVEVYDVN